MISQSYPSFLVLNAEGKGETKKKIGMKMETRMLNEVIDKDITKQKEEKLIIS